MFPQPHGIPFGLQVVPILVLLPLLLILLLVVLLLFTIAIDIANTTATATAPTAAIGAAAAAARLLLLLVLLLLLRLLLRGVGYRDHTIGAGGSSTRNMWTYILLVFLLLHQFEYCPAVSDSCWTPGNEWWEHLLRIRCPVDAACNNLICLIWMVCSAEAAWLSPNLSKTCPLVAWRLCTRRLDDVRRQILRQHRHANLSVRPRCPKSTVFLRRAKWVHTKVRVGRVEDFKTSLEALDEWRILASVRVLFGLAMFL